jgi:sterol desaturase/sphingolipid hydroxylase (fatty acid hydroxylase superfamily)
MGSWLRTFCWLFGLAVAFGIAVRLMPCNPGMYWWKDVRAVFTDFVYWFIVPLFLPACRLALLVVGGVLLFGGREPGFEVVKNLSVWQQCVAVLLIQDVLLYGSHRLFHSRLGWRFHAIHHSPKVLDWMSTSRFHPVNLLLSGTTADVAVLLMGFDPRALLLLLPFNTIYSAMVHANLNWTFGPLKYVFASPVFHRWHHTMQEEGLDKNFASTFPVLDLIFGTFYMPAGKLPEHFGNGDPDFPEGFFGQLFYPFRVHPSDDRAGAVQWARQRPRAAALLATSVVAGAGLLLGGVYFTVRLQDKNQQLTGALARAKFQQSLAEEGRYAMQLDLAQRALAENDLVRASALLDKIPEALQQTQEQQHLRELCRQKCKVLAGHQRPVTSVALSADQKVAVTGSEDGMVRVWDARTGQEKLVLKGHTRQVRSIGISGDGQRIVSGSFDQTAKVWDSRTGKQLLTLRGHEGAILSIAISADGRRIASGGADMTARVWDAQTGQQMHTLKGHIGAVLRVALSADGSRLVTASGETAKVWNTEKGQELRTLKGHTQLVYAVAISEDGKTVVSGSFDESVRVWDAETGKPMRALTGHTGPVFSVAISAGGGRIVSGGKDRVVKVWNAHTGQDLLSLKGHLDSVTGVAISGDGRTVLSGSADWTAKVWDSQRCAYREPVDVTLRD